MSDLQNIKNRFGIIGNYPALNRALEKAIQVAPTDISVLVIGESGTGKEFIPKIIHSESKRKHQPYIVVNCGAIPEGTIGTTNAARSVVGICPKGVATAHAGR